MEFVELFEGFCSVWVVDRLTGIDLNSLCVHMIRPFIVTLWIILVSDLLVIRTALLGLLRGVVTLEIIELILIWILPILLIEIVLLIIILLRLLLLEIILIWILRPCISLILLLIPKYLRKIFKVLKETIRIKGRVWLIINVDIVIGGILLEIYIGVVVLGHLGVFFSGVHCIIDGIEDSFHEIRWDILLVLLGVVLSISHI